MTPRLVLITGANRGIGREIALRMAGEGYQVVMACRNVSKALLDRDDIRARTGNALVDVLPLDLSSLASVRMFADAFRSTYRRLNVLINNAGILAFSKGSTSDGFEQTVGVNYLGPFLLTSLLLPLFPTGEDNRIINLTSMVWPLGTFDIERFLAYKGLKAYAVSKYAILLWTMFMADKLAVRGITVQAVHPGVVRTGIFSQRKWYDVLINTVMRPFLLSVEQGALPVLTLALEPQGVVKTARYFKGLKEQSLQAGDVPPALIKVLMQRSADWVNTRM